MKSYKQALFGTEYPKRESLEKALDRAWETRSFEIELYWKRALYFWGFISAIFVAYVAVLDLKLDMLALLLSLAGVLFSFSFYLANRGSKFWQENWEAHIDILESEMEGNLYKVVMKQNKKKHILSAMPYSVSNINSFLSLFLTVFWIFLFLENTKIYNQLAFLIIDLIDKACFYKSVIMIILPILLLGSLYFLQKKLQSSFKKEGEFTNYNMIIRQCKSIENGQEAK